MTASIAKKLAEASKKIGFIKFDAKNDFHGYKYASAASIIAKLNTTFAEVGIAVTSEVVFMQNEAVRKDDGSPKGYMAVVHERLTFTDTKTGESLTTDGVGSGSDKGDKALMKASTAAYKYAIAHALVLGWGAEDPEADRGTDEAAAAKPRARRSKAKVDAPTITVADLSVKIAAMTKTTEKDVRRAIVSAKSHLTKSDYDNLVASFKNKQEK